MKVRVEVVSLNTDGEEQRRQILTIERRELAMETLGVNLTEGKALLAGVQNFVVSQQAREELEQRRACPRCRRRYTTKDSGSTALSTVFGRVEVPNPRWNRCGCQTEGPRTFRPMRTSPNGQTTPEMLYLETKWASLIPFARATDLLKEVLPVGDLMNAETVRNHLQCARCRADPDCLPPRPARVRVGEPALGSGRPAPRAAANDRISNGIAGLPIFPHYSFELDALYGAVDGQKFGAERPTVKARHSRKYFGRGKGVVAYTLLCNHVPLQGWLIGAHEYEAHHVFDIWYRNTSDIVPAAITGDMHSVNKANFAVLHWFGPRFAPRFTDLGAQLKQLYCADDVSLYEKFLIRPVGQVDLPAIVDEKVNIDQIVATLGLKEMTQGTLIRKLCTFTTSNPTRRAILEFDKLILLTYNLRYLR